MTRKTIRLTESQLKQIIKESVNKMLKEGRGHFGDIVDMVTEKFNDFYAAHREETDIHIDDVKKSGKFNDLETRLAWDIARAARDMEWMPKDEQGYGEGNDAKLTTLFKQASQKTENDY